MTARPLNADFRCNHCAAYILALSVLSAVNHRNHCPYCLWSRHLDLVQAGDRLSACKAPMRPLGLTLKSTRNKYSPLGGELMLVHLCTECGRVSINRIAADDECEALFQVFRASLALPAQSRAALARSGIHVLEAVDEDRVDLQLLGEPALRVLDYSQV
jgi:hypothetical protein